jgi:hypothetical protein
MSQTWRITFNVDIGGVATDLDVNPTLQSEIAPFYGVKNTSSGAIIIASGTTMNKLSTGRYYYDLTVDAVEAAPVVAYLTQYTRSVYWTLHGVSDFFVKDHTTDALASTTLLTPIYADLVTEIQDAFPDITNVAKLGRIIKSAYTMLLYPPEVVVEGRRLAGYKWDWASPGATLRTIVEYETGTLTVTAGDATILLADGVSGDDYTFTVVSTTGLNAELSAPWAMTTQAGLSYELHYHPDYYDLPADFGGMAGENMFGIEITGQTSVIYTPVLVRSVDQVVPYYLSNTNPGTPRYAVIMPAAFVPGTGQRYQIGLYPIPDDDYALLYRYNVNLDAMAAGQYPPGGPQCARALRACCKGCAELLEAGGAAGHYYGLALEALASAIAHDLSMRPRNLGPMQENSDAYGYVSRLNGGLFYNGVDITI